MPQPIHTLQVDALEVAVYASQAEMAAAATLQVRQYLTQLLAHRPAVAAIFASATSQVQFLAVLTAAEGIDWPRVTVFHMDEYLGLKADHPASFRRFMREHLARRLPLRAFHELTGEADQPIDECERYARLLAAQPVELCCLGIGENGHIAFNDPPVADFADPRAVKLVRLDEACRRQQVGEGCFPTLESVPQYAYTLTVPALCRAQRLFCIVPEARKAEAVRRTLTGPISPACPATALRRHPRATLFLDADSAGDLLPAGPG